MKTVYVNGKEVQLNNVDASEELSPSIVRFALNIAYGNTRQSAIVHDNENGYKVSPGGMRKMRGMELFDAGIGDW